MATARQVIDVAQGEVGYSRWNDPQAGTKYGRAFAEFTGNSYFAQSGVPYCAMFVWWVLHQCGVELPGMPTASCGTMLSACEKAGLVLPDKRDARLGDIMVFDWPAVAGGTDHTGFCKSGGDRPKTIEGNTSATDAGSQGNGGVVAERTRDWSVVQAVIRPNYTEDDMTSEQAKQLQAVFDEITSTDDPSGRGVKMTMAKHIKWMASAQREQTEILQSISDKLDKMIEIAEKSGDADK